MTDEITKARELYNKYGLQQANFIAFDKMQQSDDEKDIEYWLHVINQIAMIDIDTLDQQEKKEPPKPNRDKWGNA